VTDTLGAVQVRALSIEGLWEFIPVLRPDDRGVFLESFKASEFQATVGHPFDLKQVNISSSKALTVRGVHFADVPPGQAKYIQCMSGRILDVVVDIRVGSPTFGTWDAVELDDQTRTGLYVSEGLGHAFCALSDSATVAYLCSEPYAPTHEHGITPVDPALDLPWPAGELVLSPKDAHAPTLAQALESGLLPQYAECVAYVGQARSGGSR
jgi:dTDP-4-dehydrorhamnose 3,5-epimerase